MSESWPTLAQARAAQERGRGHGVRIAILDSGVEASHPALKGIQLADDLAFVEQGFEIGVVPGKQEDVFGHGTAVCDIIHRLVPEAEIGSFRVLGEGLRSRTVIIRQAAALALERGYHILNCSFGCGREDQVLLYKEWVDEAYIRGRHIVAACNNHDFTRREWPGHFPSVITVNLMDSCEPEVFWFREGYLVEFGARGELVDVAWRGASQKKVTGSSFAVPHVTAMLARLLSHCPGLNPLQAKALLRALARPWEQINDRNRGIEINPKLAFAVPRL